MASFSVSFLGCKVSYADGQAVRERLLRDGHAEVADGGDVAVVNTCCVTHEAISKSRPAVSRAAKSHGRVFVTGCGANLGGAFDRTAPNVTVVALPSEEMPIAVSAGVGALGSVQAAARLERTRAFVKIQDGCSFSCSFCVIPLVRGGTRSRRADAVLGEIERRIAQGHREIVLTGVNLGCFRDREAGYTLPRLVREAGALPGVERLRLSLIEVNHLTGDLVAALRETLAASCHLHVPLQSGDDTVLRAMRRRYSAQQYVAKLGPLDDFNLTADVIVGFPSEDEEAFQRTLGVVEQAGLSRLHVFPYSPRPGTRTDGVDPVPPVVKRDRSACLRALSDELSRRRWVAKVGSTDRVLVDRPGRGYGDDYTPWLVDGEVGQLLHARAVGVSEEGILAVAA